MPTTIAPMAQIGAMLFVLAVIAGTTCIAGSLSLTLPLDPSQSETTTRSSRTSTLPLHVPDWRQSIAIRCDLQSETTVPVTTFSTTFRFQTPAEQANREILFEVFEIDSSAPVSPNSLSRGPLTLPRYPRSEGGYSLDLVDGRVTSPTITRQLNQSSTRVRLLLLVTVASIRQGAQLELDLSTSDATWSEIGRSGPSYSNDVGKIGVSYRLPDCALCISESNYVNRLIHSANGSVAQVEFSTPVMDATIHTASLGHWGAQDRLVSPPVTITARDDQGGVVLQIDQPIDLDRFAGLWPLGPLTSQVSIAGGATSFECVFPSFAFGNSSVVLIVSNDGALVQSASLKPQSVVISKFPEESGGSIGWLTCSLTSKNHGWHMMPFLALGVVALIAMCRRRVAGLARAVG